MSDDLVKRLREVGGISDHGATRWYINPDGPEAANRIDELGAANDKLSCDALQLCDRIEKLEAALWKYADEDYNGYNANGTHARKTLEGKDD